MEIDDHAVVVDVLGETAGRRSIHRSVIVTTALLAAAAIATWGVTHNAADVSAIELSIRPGRLVLATAFEIVLLAWTVALWQRIIESFDAEPPPLTGLLAIWRRSTLAKYLPGGVWSAAVAAEMAERAGGSPVAVTASFVIQATFTLIAAVVVSAFFYGGASAIGRPAALGVLGLGLALAHPSAINRITRFAARRSGHVAPEWTASWPRGAALLLLHAMTWVAFGGVFALLVSSLTPSLKGTPWPVLAGINAAAFAAGFVAVFAPGGIGVRESMLVVLLAPLIPALSTRLTLAAASRLWLVSTEILGGALSFAVTTRPRRRHSPARVTTIDVSDRPSSTTAVELLVDSRRALPLIIDLCNAAHESISISQLAFDADCAPYPEDGVSSRQRLLDALIAAARRGVDVRIILNGGLLLDTMPALRRGLAECGAGDALQLRSIKAFPRMMHAKALIVDRCDAVLMGASFVHGYWTGAAHIAAGEPNAHARDGDRPLHDVALWLRGSAAATLSDWFDELWTSAPHDAPAYAPTSDEATRRNDRSVPAPISGDRYQTHIARTMPPRHGSSGSTEILDAYLRAIHSAESYIALESQYFSARPIAAAVRAALDARPSLQVILTINQNPDITGYRGWQNARLREYGLLDHPRVGVFALWSTVSSVRAPGKSEITQVFVHSKVAFIDDRWATVGSANLDGASLHSYGDDFASAIGRRIFGHIRNYDINAVIVDRDAEDGVVARSRCALWSRHLGAPVCGTARPEGGWLRLWREAAAANVAALRAGRPMRGRVLPYVTAPHPRAQLAALGVDPERDGLVLRFDPGWTEVLCSPGWMKRLLPEALRARR